MLFVSNMIHLLEIVICIIIILLGVSVYIFTKYIDVQFEDGED